MTTTEVTVTQIPERNFVAWEVAVQVTVLTLILVGTIIGNTLVCLCVYVKQEMKTITAMFLVNLAIADLGTGLFCVPMAIAAILDLSILRSEFTCNLNAFCLVFFFMTSINTMAATGVYKYWTVAFPMRSKITSRHAFVMILLIWLTAGILAAGPIFGWNHYFLLTDRYQCSPGSPQTMDEYSHLLAILIFGFALPVPLMAFCYARVYVISKNHFKRMKRNTLSDMRLLQSEAHLIATLWIVLVAFVLCWLPFFAYLIAGIMNKKIPFYLPILAFNFGYSNSTLNPVVYALRLQSFRKGFHEIVVGCCKRNTQPAAYLTYDHEEVENALDATANALHTALPKNAMKKVSVVYVLPGSNNKGFLIEEGVKTNRKVSAYKISANNSYPLLEKESATVRNSSSFDTEGGPRDGRSSSRSQGAVAILDASRKKSIAQYRGVSTATTGSSNFCRGDSFEGANDNSSTTTGLNEHRLGSLYPNISVVLENGGDKCETELDEGNFGPGQSERELEANSDRQVDVISLTETRYENFCKIVRLCKAAESMSPQGEYQVTRSIDSQYDIHLILNPSVNEISTFGSPCIYRVLRTLTWEDVYYDSLGNAVMRLKHEISRNEEVEIQELPLYMREHVRLERQQFLV